jgi:hypothetical protein
MGNRLKLLDFAEFLACVQQPRRWRHTIISGLARDGSYLIKLFRTDIATAQTADKTGKP